jgi:hypothetical protein
LLLSVTNTCRSLFGCFCLSLTFSDPSTKEQQVTIPTLKTDDFAGIGLHLSSPGIECYQTF